MRLPFALLTIALAACATANLPDEEQAAEPEIQAHSGKADAAAAPPSSDLPVPPIPAPASCSDGIKNASETDIDCGGSCAPCALGRMCSKATECGSGNCTGGVCCTPLEITMTTGKVSGTRQICCLAGATLKGPVVDCGSGSNHSAKLQGNCGVAQEGGENGGSACASITCVSLACAPEAIPDAGGGG